MNGTEYERFTNQLIARLASDAHVLGLIALGSMADPSYRDQWSDHDFWLVVEPGAQRQYLDDFSWLPEPGEILTAVAQGQSYYTLLYRDRHRVEFAVFDTTEAQRGRIERFRVLLDRGDIEDLARSVCHRTHQERSRDLAWPHALDHLCTLIWTACCLHRRGEGLAATQYVEAYAVGALLDLVHHHRVGDAPPMEDHLNPRRRLEQLCPELAAELASVLQQPVPAVGLALLRIAMREVAPTAPDLPWSNVATVRCWLEQTA
jgi:hypothetical protein